MKKVNEMKKVNQRIATLMTIMLTVAMMLTACGQAADETEVKEETVLEEAGETTEPLAEEDLDGILTGIEDHYVLQDAKDVDYMHDVIYEETVDMSGDDSNSEKYGDDVKNARIIDGVSVDNSKVNASVPGTYKVIYTVKVNRPVYEKYVKLKAGNKDEKDSRDVEQREADVGAANAEEAIDGVSEEDLEEVSIEKVIEVVDQERARELAEVGASVWADKNRDYGEILDEEKKAGESTAEKREIENTQETTADKYEESTKENVDADMNTGTSSNSSTKSTNSNSNTATKHTHNYTGTVTKATTCGSSGIKTYKCSCGVSYTESIPATGNHSWKTIYTEKQVWVQDSAGYTELKCQRCGYTTTDHNAIVDHAEICGGSWSTRYHEAIGHYETEKVASGSKCSVCGATK